MKVILYILVGLTSSFINISATNYYFSNSTGNDSYTSIQARSPNSPWKTIDKLNNSMGLFKPGDSILLKRGDNFIGQIVLSLSGANGRKIVFGAYGSGKSPIIKGTIVLTKWTKYVGNIWVTDFPMMGSTVTNLFVNGKSQQIGRYPDSDDPNSGYLNIDSHADKMSFSSSSLAGYNWAGAEAIMRTRRWIIERIPIQSQQGSTLILNSPVTYDIINDYGFFIQNHISTLNKDGEWHFKLSSKKVYLYSKSDPNLETIEVTAFYSLFKAYNRDYFSIVNLDFSGSLSAAVEVTNCKHFEIYNSNISESGNDGINISSSDNIAVINNVIKKTNNNALVFNRCNNIKISKNTIKGTGLRAGMLDNSEIQASGIYIKGNNVLCDYNNIDSVGYIGIFFRGDTINVNNNYINHFCMIKNDGGGIYTGSSEEKASLNRILENNIVMNGIGAGNGTTDPGFNNATGIYLDDFSSYTSVLNNSIANCSGYGVFVHNANNFTLKGNTVFNNSFQLGFLHDYLAPEFPIRNGLIVSNIFYSRSIKQQVASFRTIKNDISLFGSFNNNYYCRPINDFSTFYLQYLDVSNIMSEFIDLKTWKETYKLDLYSNITPYKIPSYDIINYLSNNEFANGAFDNDFSEWSCWSNNGNGKAAWENSSILDNGCLKLSFNETDGNEDGYLLAIGDFGEVTKNDDYILKFSMISTNSEKKISVTIRSSESPYDVIANTQNIYVTNNRKEYELLFTPDTSISGARVDIKIDEDDEIYWIDNIELYKAKINKVITEDSVKFFYNPTSSKRKVTDNTHYIDVKGTQYYNFEIPPYSSFILVKNTNFITNSPSETISYPPLSLFPNPAADLITIQTSNYGDKTVTVLDLYGRIIYEANSSNDSISICTSNWKKGIYIVNIEGSMGKETAKFVVL